MATKDDQKEYRIPEPVDFSLKSSNLSCNVTCGSCVFFTARSRPEFREPCSQLGIQAKRTPCKRFTPNPAVINMRTDKTMRQFAKVLAKLSRESLPVIASVLLREAVTRSKGFHFGQPVYVKAFGGEYISNYRKAFVVFASRKLVWLTGGKNVRTDSTFMASIGIEHVLTVDQWEKKSSKLRVQGKVKDPKLKYYTSTEKLPEIDKLAIPTVDSYWKSLIGSDEKKAKRRSMSNFHDIEAGAFSEDTFSARV